MGQLNIVALRGLVVPVLLLMTLPVVAAPKLIDASSAGVIGDGVTKNTAAIQKSIDGCAAAGGGVVHFGAGRYLTGTIQLKSNVTLYLDKDAVILGSPDGADYRNPDPFLDGVGEPMGSALIVAVGADRPCLEGPGTVDGQGLKVYRAQKPFIKRPFLVRWVRCTNVAMHDVHLTNPGAWTLEFFQTIGAIVENVTIRSRAEALSNNDGIDIDSSENIHVQHCDVISGDDALVIKSTSDRPSRNIFARDSKLSTRTNAIKLGTESYGGFENINISNCQIANTRMAGIALYEVDGGELRHVTISDITMDGVAVPISIRLGARLRTFRNGERPRTIGALREVTIRNVSAKDVAWIGMLINGIPGHPVDGLMLDNIRLELPGGGTPQAAKVLLAELPSVYPEYDMFGDVLPACGIYARHVRGMILKDVRMTNIRPDARPMKVFIDVNAVPPPPSLTDSMNLQVTKLSQKAATPALQHSTSSVQ
jgi:glycosyl hydrolase family 28/pectate lyase-like protein